MQTETSASRRTNEGHLPYPFGPSALLKHIEIFKTGMRDIQRELETNAPTRGNQQKVERLCEGMKRALSLQVAELPHQEKSLGAFVLEETAPYFMLGHFNDRAYSKPMGYAGDYWTIELLYRNQPQGVGLLGEYIDRWTMDFPSGQAVRNRRQTIASLITELSDRWQGGEPMPICSLASGPAKEIFDVLTSEQAPSIHATCIDIDPKAIDYARKLAVKWGVDDRVTFGLDNVIRMSLGRGRLSVAPQQLVYSMGLIDYLSDRLVVSLLDWTYDHLLPGGKAAFGNFDAANPDRVFLDHIMKWELIHRSPDELRGLFARSRFGPAAVEVRRDDTGVQLIAVCTKGA